MCTPAKCKNSVSPPGNCGRKKLFCNSLIVSYTLFLSTVPGHYQSIALIPDGTRNIQIKELSGFKNYLGKFKSGCKLIIASLSSIISIQYDDFIIIRVPRPFMNQLLLCAIKPIFFTTFFLA